VAKDFLTRDAQKEKRRELPMMNMIKTRISTLRKLGTFLRFILLAKGRNSRAMNMDDSKGDKYEGQQMQQVKY
jgi:hypothetical protein